MHRVECVRTLLRKHLLIRRLRKVRTSRFVGIHQCEDVCRTLEVAHSIWINPSSSVEAREIFRIGPSKIQDVWAHAA